MYTLPWHHRTSQMPLDQNWFCFIQMQYAVSKLWVLKSLFSCANFKSKSVCVLNSVAVSSVIAVILPVLMRGCLIVVTKTFIAHAFYFSIAISAVNFLKNSLPTNVLVWQKDHVVIFHCRPDYFCTLSFPHFSIWHKCEKSTFLNISPVAILFGNHCCS